MKKISVCVPTYNRPHTLRQLINSFLKQNYKNKELIISDDTPNDSIKKLIDECKSPSIKYFHNLPGLGFSQNFLKSIERATGDYLITLGDDDILLDENVLSQYVNIFDKYPDVGFAYSNMLQFSESLKIETIINFLQQDEMFKKGQEAMKHIWIRSIFIGGIGIRNFKDLRGLYPNKRILHPQVEFIGNIINMKDAYLIAKKNIGFRSHNDQIIFRALRDKSVRQEGDHMTVELYQIFNDLNKKYNLKMNFDYVADELINQQIVMMFKEKKNLGIKQMEKHYKKFCELSPRARKSYKLKLAFNLAKYLPSEFMIITRSLFFNINNIIHLKEYDKLEKQLLYIISS